MIRSREGRCGFDEAFKRIAPTVSKTVALATLGAVGGGVKSIMSSNCELMGRVDDACLSLTPIRNSRGHHEQWWLVPRRSRGEYMAGSGVSPVGSRAIHARRVNRLNTSRSVRLLHESS